MHITTRYCEVTAMDNVQARNLARGKIGTILLAVVKNFNCKKKIERFKYGRYFYVVTESHHVSHAMSC